MITLFRADNVYAPDQIRDVLAAQIQSLARRIVPVGPPLKILRWEFPLEPLDILTWLHNQCVARKIYWSERAGGFEVGGIGVADVLEGGGLVDYAAIFADMGERLSEDNPNLRYYGGMNFDGPLREADWQGLGAYRFIVPRFELLKNGRGMSLALNMAVRDMNPENIDEVARELEAIDFSPQTVYRRPPKVMARRDCPDRQGWEEAFAKIKGGGTLRHAKIVLARKSVFDFDVYINPSALLKHLKDRTPQCFHFCFQTDKTTAFLGASPERLYQRNGERIKTEAVAGTIPRGSTREEDAVFAQKLLGCSKNAREHRYVVEAIREALNGLCVEIQSDAGPHLVKLGAGQHLVTRLGGVLCAGMSDSAVMARLHPTPAVGGCPREEALRAIREIEPFARGWYAGPVGWVGCHQSEFAVGIRSALVHHDTLSLYAGAGIVEGSSAQEEWDEIEMKIGSFIEVFNKIGC